MISEPDRPSRNPLTLARVSIQGLATVLHAGSSEFENARSLYLAQHPTSDINFELPDFLLIGVHPQTARFIAGFGKIFDLDREAWTRLSASAPSSDSEERSPRARSIRRSE
jgi:hypothetical protein